MRISRLRIRAQYPIERTAILSLTCDKYMNAVAHAQIRHQKTEQEHNVTRIVTEIFNYGKEK